jgi:hypothetical protein
MAAAAAAPAPGSREPIRTLHAQGYVNRSAQARKNYEDARRWLADWSAEFLNIRKSRQSSGRSSAALPGSIKPAMSRPPRTRYRCTAVDRRICARMELLDRGHRTWRGGPRQKRPAEKSARQAPHRNHTRCTRSRRRLGSAAVRARKRASPPARISRSMTLRCCSARPPRSGAIRYPRDGDRAAAARPSRLGRERRQSERAVGGDYRGAEGTSFAPAPVGTALLAFRRGAASIGAGVSQRRWVEGRSSSRSPKAGFRRLSFMSSSAA